VENIDGPNLIPSTDTLRLLPPVDVKTAIRLNNIGSIDPSGALVTLDFELALFWTDDRLGMPLFWDRVDPAMRRDGIRLERIYRDSAGRSVVPSCHTHATFANVNMVSFIWLPDIFFYDGITIAEQGNVSYPRKLVLI
jgi:hypothetical protein